MQLTIVEPDNITIVDDRAQQFDLTPFDLPEHFWALQWQTNKGHIEYNLSEVSDQPPDIIDALPDWTKPILTEHERLTKEQEEQQEASARQSLFINNGQARKDRIQQQTIAKKQHEQQQINRFVKEQMP